MQVQSYNIDKETVEKIKSQTEFIYFFSGKAYEEKLYIVPNYKVTNSESFLIELNNFLKSLPLWLLNKLSIHNFVVITANKFSDYVLENNFVVTRFKEDNLSINITKQDNNYSLNLYKNDLVVC